MDAAVHAVQHLRCARDATLAGAGGTDLRYGFAAVDRQRPRPDVVIAFTDADTPWPAAAPPAAAVIAAVWVAVTSHFHPPRTGPHGSRASSIREVDDGRVGSASKGL